MEKYKIEVTQTWAESEDSKTGWELEQCWIDDQGFEIFDKYVAVTDTDKFGHPIKGYFADDDMV